jgi:ribosomal protein S18 acetylase RimI-like enzyme
MEAFEIRPPGATELPEVADLLARLNPGTPREVIRERLDEILAGHPHYHLVCAYAGDRIVGVAAAWIATKIWCGRYLEIDNLVVDEGHRSSGIGSRLIQHLEAFGRSRDCKILVLDSYTSNHPSHRLYHRLGFEIWGFHFIKPIGDWRGDGGP